MYNQELCNFHCIHIYQIQVKIIRLISSIGFSVFEKNGLSIAAIIEQHNSIIFKNLEINSII